jgi:hypothetical protein
MSVRFRECGLKACALECVATSGALLIAATSQNPRSLRCDRSIINIAEAENLSLRKSALNVSAKGQNKSKKSLGALRKHQKTKPRSPDATGKLYFQRHTLVDRQLDEVDGDEISCNIAAWKNNDQRGPYLTVEVSPEFVPYERRRSDNESFNDMLNEEDEQ